MRDLLNGNKMPELINFICDPNKNEESRKKTYTLIIDILKMLNTKSLGIQNTELVGESLLDENININMITEDYVLRFILFYHYYNLAYENAQQQLLAQNTPHNSATISLTDNDTTSNTGFENVPNIKILLSAGVSQKKYWFKTPDPIQIKVNGLDNIIFNLIENKELEIKYNSQIQDFINEGTDDNIQRMIEIMKVYIGNKDTLHSYNVDDLDKDYTAFSKKTVGEISGNQDINNVCKVPLYKGLLGAKYTWDLKTDSGGSDNKKNQSFMEYLIETHN